MSAVSILNNLDGLIDAKSDIYDLEISSNSDPDLREIRKCVDVGLINAVFIIDKFLRGEPISDFQKVEEAIDKLRSKQESSHKTLCHKIITILEKFLTINSDLEVCDFEERKILSKKVTMILAERFG